MKRAKIFLILFLIFTPTRAQNQKSTWVVNREIKHFKNAISISGNNSNEIFVLDDGNEMLYKFSGEGELLDSVGGKGWSELNFNGAKDVSATFPLSIFITEENNRRIQKLDRNFSLSTIINYEVAKREDESKFKPIASTLSNQGELFVIEADYPSLLKFNANDNFEKEIAGKNIHSQLLQIPIDIVYLENETIAVLEENKIFIFDRLGNLLRKIKIKNQNIPKSISSFGENLLITYAEKIIAINSLGEEIFLIEPNLIVGAKNLSDFRDIFWSEPFLFLITQSDLLILEKIHF